MSAPYGGISKKADANTFVTETITKEMAQQIVKARVAKKLTRKQLAQASCLTEKVIEEYETGKAVIRGGKSSNEMRKIGKALGIQLKKTGDK